MLQILAAELKNPTEHQELRDKVFNALPSWARTNPSDLWIDLPNPPDVDKEAQLCPVILAPGHVEALSALMPADDWVRSYVANKLRGHVFYDQDRCKREQVASAAGQVIRDEYGIKLRLPLARSLALKE